MLSGLTTWLLCKRDAKIKGRFSDVAKDLFLYVKGALYGEIKGTAICIVHIQRYPLCDSLAI